MTEYTAQYGEDRLLERLFRDRTCGCCIEVGAHDGIVGSATLLFERRGWTTVLVEPNPDLCEEIRRRRTGRLFACAAGAAPGQALLTIPAVSDTLSTLTTGRNWHLRDGTDPASSTVEVEVRTLDHMLSEAGVTAVDFATIDVEGFELEVLRGFDLDRWRPRVLILEDNDSGTNDAVPRYMRRAGYVRFLNTGCNDWFARPDDREALRLGSITLTRAKKFLKAVKRSAMMNLLER